MSASSDPARPAATDRIGTSTGGIGTRAVTARRRRASGIYGTVVTAAVLASAGGHLPAAALAVAVLVTLVVYWGAEQYAEILGEQAEHGRLPTWREIRIDLARSWSMVSAAYLPVVALLVCRLFGASQIVAANVALMVAVILLLFHGWSAGRAAELHGARLFGVTLIAGSLGVLMIILKNFVVTNLH